MLAHVVKLPSYVISCSYVTTRKRNINFHFDRRTSIFNYVTLPAVQNDLHLSVCTIFHMSKDSYEGVESNRGGSKHIGD